MPVSRETSISGPFVPNGVARSFSFDFKATTPGEVVALDQDGNVISQALYSVEIDDDEGGALVFAAPPQVASYSEIYVAGDPALTQPSDFDNAGSSFNPAALTRALDRAAARDLKQQRELDRSFKVPFGEAGMQLPGSAVRAGKYIAFDALGAPMMASGTGVDGDLRGDMAADDGGLMLAFKASAAFSRKRTMQDKGDEQLLTPADFVQPGDTVLQRLQRFVDALGNGVHGRLDADYTVPSQVVIGYKSRFKLYGNGYTIKVADGAATGYGGSALYFVSCTDFEIIDLICDGNRDNRTPAEDPAHVIVIDKCHDWTFTRVKAINGTCDGFLIYAGSEGNGSGVGGAIALEDCPSHWVMDRCEALGNYRQGCTVAEGFWGDFIRGRYGLTSGLWDVANGPCAGIDIEPDPHPGWVQNRVANISFDRVLFDQNQGPGLLITNIDGVSNIKVNSCSFDRNRKAAIETFAENVDIDNPHVMGWDTTDYTARVGAPAKSGAITVGYLAGSTRIRGALFTGISNAGAGNANPCIYVHGDAAEGIEISGLRTDGSASDIGGLHAARIVLRDSDIDLTGATEGTHLTFLGAEPQMQNVTLRGVYQRAAYFGGVRPRIRDNTLYVRVADHTNWVIDVGDTTNPEVARNHIIHDAAVATYGINFPNECIANDNLAWNNTHSDAFAFTGTPLIRRGNLRGGVLQPETAITP